MNRPMYRQLYDSFQQTIVDGQLRPGPVLALQQKQKGWYTD
jgi:DNA-binding transcriptional regulator YhcF (GntR family)